MNGAGLHIDEALDQAELAWTRTVETVTDDDLAKTSGCAGWTIADLVNHVAGGGHRYAILLGGGSAQDTEATRGNDYIGAGVIEEFWRYEELFREAARKANPGQMVDHRAGPRPAVELLGMRVMDLTLHSKDLCDGLATTWEISDELALYILNEVASLIEELRALGMFGPATETTSPSPVERLLAFTGRR